MLRRIALILIMVAVAAALSWALWPKPVSVETEIIERRVIVVTVEEEGKSQIREVYTVSAPTTGKVLRLNLHAGDDVVKDKSVIASIKPTEPTLLDVRSRKVAEANVEAARAAVDLAQAQVQQAAAQLEYLNSELKRASVLVKRGTIADRTFDKASLDAAVAAAEHESAAANLQLRKRQLEGAQAVLADGSLMSGQADCCVNVLAPVSGKVLRVLSESEQVVQAGTPLLDLGDPGNLEVVVDVLSSDAVRIVPGAAAMIEGWGGAPLPARVSRIDPAAVTKISALGIEEQRVNVLLKLRDPVNSQGGLGHGFRVVARITVWQGKDRLAVPIGALFRQGGEWTVFVVRQGLAHLQPLRLGERNFDYADVLEGLALGDEVIIHPSDMIADGAKVVAPRP